MRCLTCAYDLSASHAGPCPECGRPFDPADRRTYRSAEFERRQARQLTRAIALLSLPPLLFIGLVHVAYVAAGISLGHRPRLFLDDPNAIPAAVPYLAAAYFAGIAMFPCLVTAFILWLLLVCLHPARCLPALLLFLALWGGSFLFLWWDPFSAFTWFAG